MNVILLIMGVIAGVCSGIFGIGGGIILVPLLMIVLKFNQIEAGAISLVSLLLPVGALGVWEFYKKQILHQENIHFGLYIALGYSIRHFPWYISGSQISTIS